MEIYAFIITMILTYLLGFRMGELKNQKVNITYGGYQPIRRNRYLTDKPNITPPQKP
jgi:hypothetical protein